MGQFTQQFGSFENPLQAMPPLKEDFRCIIERKYESSVVNRVYQFPRKNDSDRPTGPESEDASSDSDTSLKNLRYVTRYDLNH